MKQTILLICLVLFTCQVLGANPTTGSDEIEKWVRDELLSCESNNFQAVFYPSQKPPHFLPFLRPRLEHPNGWYYPAGSSNYQYLGWLGFNPNFNGYHLAQDMSNPEGDPVYAIDYGEVIYSQCVGGYGGPSGGSCGGAVSIQHRTKDGTWFTALYGHLNNYLPVGARVYAGDIIGYSNNWNPPHVHFGVRLGYNPDSTNWARGYTSTTGNTYGFSNPNTFLNSNFACKNGNSVSFRPNGGPPLHPNGTLIKTSTNSVVYLLRNGQKQGITSATVLRSLYPNGGFDFKDVITVAQDEFDLYPTGPAISTPLPSNGRTHSEGRLIRNSPEQEISIVTDNGMRRPFVSGAVFLSLGYLFCNVVDATDYNVYPVGPPITGERTSTCTYSISPASRTFSSGGGNGSVTVTAGSNCAWTAASNSPWITVTSGGSGSGNGTVNYSVAQNPGQPRSGTITVSGGGQNYSHTINQDPNTTISVTIQTNPSGLSIVVDGATYTAPRSFDWTAGSTHTISTPSTQGNSQSRYVWNNWSDGNTQNPRSVSPTAATTFTANFTTQHSLTMSAGNCGTVTPPGGWYNAGQTVRIEATPCSGYRFVNWTGTYNGTNSAMDIAINSPTSQTANFSQMQPGRKAFDYDGDGKADVSVFRPSNGGWYILRSSNNSVFSAAFGQQGDLVAPADFDGDGKTDVSVFRNGNWYRLNSSNNQFVAVAFGTPGDLPVSGDFDGDGKADVSVFRPSNGNWYRLNSSNNQFLAVQFGMSGDKPQVGDFDGDGKTDIAVWRPLTGNWYALRSSNNSLLSVFFGQSGDVPAPADYDGDGKADAAVFRPSNGNWYRINSGNGQFVATAFGAAGDIPAVADFDGDNQTDVAVFRPSNGTWYLLRSTAGFTGISFGTSGDFPTCAAFGQ